MVFFFFCDVVEQSVLPEHFIRKFYEYRYDFHSNLDGPMGMVLAVLLVMSGSL